MKISLDCPFIDWVMEVISVIDVYKMSPSTSPIAQSLYSMDFALLITSDRKETYHEDIEINKQRTETIFKPMQMYKLEVGVVIFIPGTIVYLFWF